MWVQLAKKIGFFAGAGALAGLAGAGAAFSLPTFGASQVAMLTSTGSLFALLAAAISAGQAFACVAYFRLPTRLSLHWATRCGVALLTGAVIGAVLQAIYGTAWGGAGAQEFVLKPICWGIFGIVLVYPYRVAVPNLRPGILLSWGFGLGVLGALSFFLPALLIPDPFGSVVGAGLLGAFLCASLPVAEIRRDFAGLEVCWPSGLRTLFALGDDPLYVGGGMDHIWLPGLKPRMGSIISRMGQVKFVDPATGQQKDMRNSSRLKVGGVELVVHAAV